MQYFDPSGAPSSNPVFTVSPAGPKVGPPTVSADGTALQFLVQQPGANGLVLWSVPLDATGAPTSTTGSGEPTGLPTTATPVGGFVDGGDGKQYVLIEDGGQTYVLVIDGNGSVSQVTDLGAGVAGDLVFDGNTGTVLLTGAGNDSVVAVSNGGTTVHRAELTGTDAVQIGSGMYTVTEAGGKAINIVDSATGDVQRVGLFGEPTDTHVDPATGVVSVLTTDGTNHYLVVVDPATGGTLTRILPGAPQGGIQTTPDGAGYVITTDTVAGGLSITSFSVSNT